MESEFYLELIAKELSGEISETEKSNLLNWINNAKNKAMLSSPLIHLYLTIGAKKTKPHSVRKAE